MTEFREKLTKAFRSIGIHVTDGRIIYDRGLFENIDEDPPITNLEKIINSLSHRKKRRFIQPNLDRSKFISTNDLDADLNFIKHLQDPGEDPVKVDPPQPKAKKMPVRESAKAKFARLKREIEALQIQENGEEK